MKTLDKDSLVGVSALLVHAAKIDEIYSDKEKLLIKEFIKSYSTDEDEDSVIISKSRAKRKTAGRKSTTSTKKRTKNPPRRRYGARSQK